MFEKIMMLALGAMLMENFVLVRLFGGRPAFESAKKVKTAVTMGIILIFVMGISSAVTSALRIYILEPMGYQYLQTVVFVVIIVMFAGLAELLIPKINQSFEGGLTIALMNCTVLGVTLLNTKNGYDILWSTIYGVFAALGFMLAAVVLAGIGEKLEHLNVPKSLQGFPIMLMSAGLIAMALQGFSGLSF